jgi:hypothetical protein
MQQANPESNSGSDSVWEVVRDSRPPPPVGSESIRKGTPSSVSTIYYYNRITGVTTAEKPEELKTDQEKFRVRFERMHLLTIT